MSGDRDSRVLVLAVTDGDAELTGTILAEAGLTARICGSVSEVCEELASGAGAIVMPEDGLAARSDAIRLAETLGEQLAWSEIPIVLLCGSGADSPLAAWAMERLGSVTILERPVRITTLVSVLRTAIATRERQYELRDQLDALHRSEESLRAAHQRSTLLWEAAATVLSSGEPEEMLRDLFARIAPPLELCVYLNYMVRDDEEILRLASWAGIPDETARSMATLDFDQAICGAVAARRQPIVASFVQDSDDPRAQLIKSLGIRVYACNPMLVGDRLLGTLSFASRRRDQLDPHEIAFLETISHYVTLAYQQAQLVRALRENDRRKDEFLATLAHELRNPLAPIRAGLDLMRIADCEPRRLDEVRSTMERQVRHMVHLIDDLMDVSRITRGKLALRREPVGLTAIVRGAVEAMRSQLEAAQHTLVLSLPDESLGVQVDPTRMTQVLTNLLSNAVKYTPPGGRIEVSAARDDDTALVCIKDDGVGIPREMQQRVFDMFIQIDTAPEQRHGGLGIGLTLVRSLVEMHGGSIEVSSDGPGRGSEFRLRLPLVAVTTSRARTRRERRRDRACPRRRVLIVDDNRDAAELLGMTVEMLGSDVFTAHDGREALALASEVHPDIVVMDIGMPGMNGYDTARRMRAEPWGQGLFLVALTGWGQEEDRRRAEDAGFDRHLVKPLEPKTLRELLAAPAGISPRPSSPRG